MVLAFGMAFHELATNAAKYGAFSAPAGRVDVSWHNDTADTGRRLRVLWAESGGPIVEPTARKGFGSRMISGLAFELDGDVQFHFDPDGVRCTFDVPLETVEKDQ
jgi:two-component sensor histidine kinase